MIGNIFIVSVAVIIFVLFDKLMEMIKSYQTRIYEYPKIYRNIKCYIIGIICLSIILGMLYNPNIG